MRNLIKNLLLGVVSLALFFFIFEAGLRLQGHSGEIFQRDFNTGLMIIRPGWEGYFIKDCFKNLVKANWEGFYDKNYIKAKDANTIRIAVLGDSFVEALQVPLSSNFTKLLEDQLDKEFLASGKKFEVLAFGHSGNGTFLNYLYMKKYALAYNPDLVINGFLSINDLKDDDYNLYKSGTEGVPRIWAVFKNDGSVDDQGVENELKQKTGGGVTAALKRLGSRSAFVMWIYPKYVLAKSRLKAKGNNLITTTTIVATSIPFDYRQYSSNYPDTVAKAWQTEDVLLKKMKDEAEAGGAKFLLLSMAEGFRTHPQLLGQEDFPPQGNFDFDIPDKKLAEIAGKNQINFLPLEPVFKEKAGADSAAMSVFPCDGHWSVTGHAWAAKAVFNYLKNNPGLLGLPATTSSATSSLK